MALDLERRRHGGVAVEDIDYDLLSAHGDLFENLLTSVLGDVILCHHAVCLWIDYDAQQPDGKEALGHEPPAGALGHLLVPPDTPEDLVPQF